MVDSNTSRVLLRVNGFARKTWYRIKKGNKSHFKNCSFVLKFRYIGLKDKFLLRYDKMIESNGSDRVFLIFKKRDSLPYVLIILSHL